MAGIKRNIANKPRKQKAVNGGATSKIQSEKSKVNKTSSSKKLWTNRQSGDVKYSPIAEIEPDNPKLIAAFEEFLMQKGTYASTGNK